MRGGFSLKVLASPYEMRLRTNKCAVSIVAIIRNSLALAINLPRPRRVSVGKRFN